MDLVVIDNIVFEDFSYVSKFDMLNKWKRYLDDQYNFYLFFIWFGIFKDIVDRGCVVKFVILLLKNLKMNLYR